MANINALINSLGEEAKIQIEVVKYAKKFEPEIFVFSIPNEQKQTSAMGFVAKLMGKRSGMPDLVLINKHQDVLFLELKTEKGKLSKSQLKTHEILDFLGFEVKTAYDLENAMTYIDLFYIEKTLKL